MPFEIPGAKKSSSFTPNEEALAMIMSMGFNTDQATKALKATVGIGRGFLKPAHV